MADASAHAKSIESNHQGGQGVVPSNDNQPKEVEEEKRNLCMPAPVCAALALSSLLRHPKGCLPLLGSVASFRPESDAPDASHSPRLTLGLVHGTLMQALSKSAKDGSPLLHHKFSGESNAKMMKEKINISFRGFRFDGPLETLGKDGYWSSTPKRVPEDQLRQRLYEAAQASPFGDIAQMQTVYDEKVRVAREIPATHFTVSSSLCRKIETLWGAYFFPHQVVAVPHKINVYGAGGHFAPHRDTPSTNMVGTFLLSLHGNPQGAGGTLKLHHPSAPNPGKRKEEQEKLQSASSAMQCEEEDEDENKQKNEYDDEHEEEGSASDDSYEWQGETGTWAAFYPEVIHEVTPLVAGLRITLAFKIFAVQQQQPGVPQQDQKKQREEKEDQGKTLATSPPLPLDEGEASLSVAPYRELLARQKLEQLFEMTEGKLGILMQHLYTVDSDVLKGQDAALLETLRRLPYVQLFITPVVIHYEDTDYRVGDDWNDGVDRHQSAQVYLLAPAHVDELLRGREKTTHPVKAPSSSLPTDIRFVGGYTSGVNVFRARDKGAAHTGNESRPAEENSVYVNMAVIALRPVLHSSNSKPNNDSDVEDQDDNSGD